MVWKRAVLYCLLPSAIALLAAGTPCAAFSADIVAPSVGPVKVEPGEEVKFEAIAQDDWGQDLTADTKWTWDFGDGQQSNQNPVWHVFKSGGSFTVTVSGCCAGEQAGDWIICQQEHPEEEGWSMTCKIEIDPPGQDIGVAPGGDVCHNCEVGVSHEGEMGDWHILDVDFSRRVGDGEWDPCQSDEDEYIVWETLGDHSLEVQWKAGVNLGLWDEEEHEYVDEKRVDVAPETWNVKNTVVESGNDVLLWDPEDPEGSQVTIHWEIEHSTVIDPLFDVTIHICGLSGDMVREFSVPGPIGVGEGSVDWDGLVEDEEENLVTADKGVYAYKVFAEDEEECHDCDKTETYTPWIESFHYTVADRENQRMKGVVRYKQPRDCGQCFIRIYGPDLDQLTQVAGETTAGWHIAFYDWVEAEIDEDDKPVGTYTAVLFTLETEEQGAGDRGPEQKWHKQKGTDNLDELKVNSVLCVEEYQGQLDPNPKAGGGKRIFPGAAEPGGDSRALLHVRATLDEAIEGVWIYFESFDVDDPSSNQPPIDDEAQSTDNRGTPKEGTLIPESRLTDANGQAVVDFTVTMQPGDNFRVVSDLNPDWLSGLVPKQDDVLARVFDGDEPVPDGKTTELLTVWRKLHVEVDSMGAPLGTSVTGNITSVVDNGDETSTATTDQNLDDSVDRFVPGSLTSEGLDFSVTANTNGANFTVTVDNVGYETPEEGPFTLIDDDVVPADVPEPVTSLLAERFEPAYIEVELDGGGDPNNNDPDAPFALNMRTEKGNVDLQGAKSRDSSSTATFWQAHCLGCFQGAKYADDDPESEQSFVGACGDRTAAVFSETQRDSGYGTDSQRAHTLVHEVGHLFDLPDESSQGRPPEYDGIMCRVTWGVFKDHNIADIRECPCPSVEAY